MKINYQRILEDTIKHIDKDKVPTLLLHACCGPCSTYVLEYLSNYFKITILFYNPNIYPSEEYTKRIEEQKKVIQNIKGKYKVNLIEGRYNPNEFFDIAKGLEDVHEGGERCFKCYELRLREAALVASKMKFDYFTTSLTISPFKNAQKLNEIGEKLGNEYNVKYLLSDFKKKEGYKRSIELSNKLNLYRQDYCGCIYSKAERDRIKNQKLSSEN